MNAVMYESHPKHILEPNGLFKWETATDIECYCGHLQKRHLFASDVCLDGLCICERFAVDKKRRSCDISEGDS
jgi:hypothetical protein